MLSRERLFPIWALLVVAALMFVYCGDSDEPTEPPDPLAGAALCLSDSSCTMGAVCDTSAAIDVTNCGNSTVLSWTAADNADWLSVSVTTGETPAEFCLMADSNRTGAERTATVTVTAGDLTDESIDIDVTQPSMGPTLVVSLSEWQPSSLGEESEKIWVSNAGNYAPLAWIAAEDEDWLTLSNTSGNTPGGFTITADAYDGDGSRTGTVTVTASGADGSPWVITVEQFCTIALVGGYDTPSYAYGIFVSGDYAYVADASGGLQIINISDSSFSLAGSYDTDGSAIGIDVSGDYAYVADCLSGLQIVDVSDPSSPVLMGSYDIQDCSYDVSVSGNYAFVASYELGLQIVDVSDPTSPSLAGSYDTPDHAYGVFVLGNYAYVADDVSGLQIIDVSDPTDPVLAGNYNTLGDNARGVFVSADYAYVADGNDGGLLIIDVSDPSDLTLVGSHSTLDFAEDVFVEGGYAFVADRDNGLRILDVSDPTSPTLVGGCYLSYYTWGVFVSGEYAYVANDQDGLVILRLGFSMD